MTPSSTKAIALAQIFLLLSLGPVDAYRRVQVEGAVDKLESYHQVTEDLRQALQEDLNEEQSSHANHSQSQGEEYIGEWFASCETRKEDFERRAGKVKARYDEAKADGTISATEGAYVLLKARSLAKTVQRAEKKGCEWAKNKEDAKALNVSALTGLVKDLQPELPCFETAKAELEKAKGLDADGQAKAVIKGMGVLVSKECKPAKVEQMSEAEYEKKLGEAEVKQAEPDEEVDDAATDLAAKVGEEEMEQRVAMEKEVQNLKAGLLDLGNSLDAEVGNPIAEALGTVLAIIVLWILFILLCWVGLVIFMFVMGLICCVIKILIVAFLRIFGSKRWDFDYLGCLGFWLGMLGHRSTGNDIHLALCAVNMMTGGNLYR